MLGPNGAGKTTTVEILEGPAGRPTAARPWCSASTWPARRPQLKERIGVQLQTAALYPNLTVTETIDLFRSFYRRCPAHRAS